MGVGISILLVTVGAVLTWGFDGGVEYAAVGLVLLFAGCAGLLLSVAVWARSPWRRTDVVEPEDRRMA
jgi:hypothetical protein